MEIDKTQDKRTPAIPAMPPRYIDHFYHKIDFLKERFLKRDKNDKPKPAPPKVPSSFMSLGTNFLGQPVEIDDRLNVFQDGIRAVSAHQLSSDNFSSTVVTLLHDKHPRPSNASPTAQQRYPFTRKIEKSNPASTRPDPRAVFEALLSSTEAAKDHPTGLSSMVFALASIVSLSIIRATSEKLEFNETSPFLDLSPLYGVNEEESNLIRANDGRGTLSPDCFFETRITLLPPAVSALLILWNRNHNYIARRLLLNNEGKKWEDPSLNQLSTNTLKIQDDEIFQIARRINRVQFKNVVVKDFLKVLMGLPNVGYSADLNILIDVKQTEKGAGHDSSVEFGLLYNWSSLVAQKDVEDIAKALKEDSGVSPDELNQDVFKRILDGDTHRNSNRQQRHSAGIRRRVDGYFDDEDLAKVLLDATEAPAGLPGARRIPSVFRLKETMTIAQARERGVCSLNEFRRYLGLKPFKSFKEWSSDSSIATAAESLYQDIENLELYPGLQAEDIVPGSGLGLGYTMTYGLLVDIVTMVRSDPEFTTELTAAKLTRWGYKDCTDSLNNGSFGAMLPKVLQRNLPRQYPYNNIYSIFPLTCPSKAKQLIEEGFRHSVGLYTYERPKFPKVKSLETKYVISHVFNHASLYPTPYGKDLKALTNGYGYFLGIDDEIHHDRDLMMSMFALIPDKGALSRYSSYFEKNTTRHIEEGSHRNNGHQSIDIVRDVINKVCTLWVCETLCGYIPEDVNKTHDMFGALFSYVFRNTDPETAWNSRDIALEASEKLKKSIDKKLPMPPSIVDPNFILGLVSDGCSFFRRVLYEEMRPGGKKLPQDDPAITFLDRMTKSTKHFPLKDPSKHDHIDVKTPNYVNEAADAHRERERAIANVLGLAVVTSVNLAQACAHAVDFYLDEKYREERKKIIELSTSGSGKSRPDANKEIMGYIREAQRLGQPLGLWREVLKDGQIPQRDGPPISVRAGERIFADLSKAHMDPQDFQDTEKVDPSRKTPSIQGMGLHKCPGISFGDNIMPEILRAIFKLKNVRRDPGKAGRLEQVALHPTPNQTDPKVFVDPTGETSHFPKSLTLLYDVDAKPITPTSDSSPLRIRKGWVVQVGEKTKKVRKYVDRGMHLVIALLLVFIILRLMGSILAYATPFSRKSPRPKKAPPKPEDVVAINVECPLPITTFQPWEINAFVPGADGQPAPIEYELDKPKAHRLSVVDIDDLDMRMALWVDDQLRGFTPDITLDKTKNCGEGPEGCFKAGFSAGMIVIPPGSHKVRIEWGGKEYINGTHDIDWGTERRRRFMWKRDDCA